MEDKNPFIHKVKLEDRTFVAKAAKFTEFELPGEYAMIPWIRIKDVISGRTIECPRHKVDFIEYY